MRLLLPLRTDIPFSRDDANRFLPWIVALMVCLTALMVSVGLSLGQSLSARHASLSREITVQLPAELGDEAKARAKKALAAAPGIGVVEEASEADIREMISPWIDDAQLAAALPIPTVLRATFARSLQPDVPAIVKALKAIDPRIAADTHAVWAEKFNRFSRAVQLGLYTLASFILATLAAMVVFTAREAMKLHRRTVLLLHAIGADDRYIARQFQSNACAVTLTGAVIGTLAGTLIFSLSGWYTRALDAPILPDFAPGGAHALALILLPPACALLALVSARLAVLSQLRRLP